jgi:hypothetical protein
MFVSSSGLVLNHRELRYCDLGTRCTLPLAYQTVPPSLPTKLESSPHVGAEFVYINYGAMTEQQGHIPTDAFEGEAEAHELLAAREATLTSNSASSESVGTSRT